MKKLTFALLFVFTILRSHAQNTAASVTWPAVESVPGLLFYIQRDPDINTVCYTARMQPDSTIDQTNPVDIFWMKYAKNGSREELNALEHEFGYSLSITAAGTDRFKMKALAFPKRKMTLLKDEKGKFVAEMKINHLDCTLKRVNIHITGGSELSPDIAYFEFFGQDKLSGRAVCEKVEPDWIN